MKKYLYLLMMLVACLAVTSCSDGSISSGMVEESAEPIEGKAYTETKNGINWRYTPRGEGVEILKTELEGNVKIPSELGGLPVTIIGTDALSECVGLTGITIPESVTTIEDRAFRGCEDLTSIKIFRGVTSIGSGAFEDCKKLTEITIPSSVTIIGDSVFYGCERLQSVKISSNVTSIGENTFRNCKRLSSVKIPKGVTSIGDGAFSGCERLTSISIPQSVTSIGNRAFEDCESLTSIKIPSSVTSIGVVAFVDCDDSLYDTTTIPGLRLVDGWVVGFEKDCPMPLNLKSVRGIANRALSGIPNIVVSNDDPKYTSQDGILYSKDMTKLICCPREKETCFIPSSVTTIVDDAFYWCPNLTSIEVSRGNHSYVSIDDVLFSKDMTKLIVCSKYKRSYSIPSGVTSIGNGAFSFSGNLTRLEIPSSVTSIGEYAFGCCSGLTSLEIPFGVRSIDDAAFAFCIELDSIEIPSSVTRIGNSAFYFCTSLVSIEIPSSVTSIGDEVFDEHYKLTRVELPRKFVGDRERLGIDNTVKIIPVD